VNAVEPSAGAPDGERSDAALRAENKRLLDDLEWAYTELAVATERIQEESRVAYAEVRDTVARLERRVAELSTLNEIGRALGATLRLDQVLDIILRRLRATLPGTLFAVAVAPRAGAPLDLSAASGDVADTEEGREAARAAARWIADTGQKLRVDDAHLTLGANLPAALERVRTCRSWLGIPLLAGEAIVGAVVLAHAAPRAFQPDDQRLLSSVAIQAAVAVNNARLYEEVVRRTRELGAVLEMSRAISSAWSGSRPVLELLAKRAHDLIECDSITIFLFDDAREYMTPIIYFGTDSEAVLRVRLRPGEGIAGLVAQTGQAELVNHAERDPRSKHVPGTAVIPESLLCAPLRARDRILGVLTISREGEREFAPEDLDFLTAVASHAAIAIENARLVESLQCAYEDLKETQDQLVASERLHALGEMASGVAHDFNNVLGVILGRAQLLLMRASDPTVVKGLKVIEQAASDGASTVKRIQNFTRLSAPSEATSVDVNAVARDAAEFARSRGGSEALSGVSLVLDLRATRPVLANAAELREVLVNLVNNAVDACPDGGEITIRTASAEDRVLITVSDTGTGMSPEIMEKIFHPFFTTKGWRGTGLGLAVSQGIVARYHGSLTVESVVGQGSAFTMTLPALPAGSVSGPDDASRSHEHKGDGPTRSDPGTILVVDDDNAVAEVLVDSLRGAGHTVHVACSAAEALDLFDPQSIDVVFTDLGMPGTDGWALTDALRSRDEDVVVIVVSGWGLQFSQETELKYRLFALLSKPLAVDDAVRVADAALRERRVRREQRAAAA
jgi:signal transduction histidine kinase/CheY-like chemotaxis protein